MIYTFLAIVSAMAASSGVELRQAEPAQVLVCAGNPCVDSVEGRRGLTLSFPAIAPSVLALSAEDDEASVARRLSDYPGFLDADFSLCAGSGVRQTERHWIVPGPIGADAPSVLRAAFLNGRLELIDWAPTPTMYVHMQFVQIVSNSCAPNDEFLGTVVHSATPAAGGRK